MQTSSVSEHIVNIFSFGNIPPIPQLLSSHRHYIIEWVWLGLNKASAIKTGSELDLPYKLYSSQIPGVAEAES